MNSLTETVSTEVEVVGVADTAMEEMFRCTFSTVIARNIIAIYLNIFFQLPQIIPDD
jgi:hypothetical protein